MSEAVGVTAPRSAVRFGVLLVLLALVAIAVREHFVLTSIVDVPIRGDIREYVAYAWNLTAHGIYSAALPPTMPTPDSYRLPGYPWLIALAMHLSPQDPAWRQLGGWYPLMLQVQVLLGAATAVLVSLLARHWLKPIPAIAAGLLLALWPHHVAATGALLSEVVLGFTLVLGCYAFARAWTTNSIAWFVAAGAAFGYAYLVNPLVLFFPPCLAAMTWWLGRRRGAAWMLALFLLPVALFAVRSAALPDDAAHSSGGRARMNLVQGSWPAYHIAARLAARQDPLAVEIMDDMSRETALLQSDPAKGIAMMRTRMSEHPFGYLRWYVIDKPLLLWDWDVQVGYGDIYFHQVRNSPLDRAPLSAIVRAFHWLNPLFSLLTLASALVLTFAGWRNPRSAPLAATASLTLYLTLVHMVLQAEPRYAIAYRGLEAVLVVTAIAWIVERIKRRHG